MRIPDHLFMSEQPFWFSDSLRIRFLNHSIMSEQLFFIVHVTKHSLISQFGCLCTNLSSMDCAWLALYMSCYATTLSMPIELWERRSCMKMVRHNSVPHFEVYKGEPEQQGTVSEPLHDLLYSRSFYSCTILCRWLPAIHIHDNNGNEFMESIYARVTICSQQ